MRTKFKKQIEEEMKDGVNSVLEGVCAEFEGFGICPAIIIEYMKSLGFTKGEFDTNGWDYDWWTNFTKDGKQYDAYGSGYSGYFGFCKNEDYECDD